MWLSDIDSQLVSSKPVGGLPETAREQLNRFMVKSSLFFLLILCVMFSIKQFT